MNKQPLYLIGTLLITLCITFFILSCSIPANASPYISIMTQIDWVKHKNCVYIGEEITYHNIVIGHIHELRIDPYLTDNQQLIVDVYSIIDTEPLSTLNLRFHPNKDTVELLDN